MAAKKEKRFVQNGFFIFAFIPYLQWVAYFIMNGHVRRKRYLVMGFANILFILILWFVPTFVDSYVYNNTLRYPKAPQESDYWGKTYDDFEEDGHINWDAYDAAHKVWRKSPEYKNYEKAYEEYMASEAYQTVYNHNQNLHAISNTASFIMLISGIISYIIYLVMIFFVERYKYLNALKHPGNSDANEIIKTLKKEQKQVNTKATSRVIETSEEDIITHHNKEAADVSPDQMEGILNVNTATEAQLAALPLINVLDAKKIISYREAHGDFNDLDEFFSSFGAKPHVIVKLQNAVSVDKYTVASRTASATTKKRFDL